MQGYYRIRIYQVEEVSVKNPYIVTRPQKRLKLLQTANITSTTKNELEKYIQTTDSPKTDPKYHCYLDAIYTTRQVSDYEISQEVYAYLQAQILKEEITEPITRVVNIKREECDVYIGRGGKWGNPYSTNKNSRLAKYHVGTKEEAIAKYADYIRRTPELYGTLEELAGQRLGCTCKPYRCHGDILIELLEEKRAKERKKDDLC